MKVGIFDSGVGGLTVLKAVRNRFRKLDIVYIGDTARVPYGNKSKETVVKYSLECADFLISKGVELLIVACNTASSHATEDLRERLNVPILGVVEPGVRMALSMSKGKVGVIGTLATINSGAYQKPLEGAGMKVFSKACPLFVPLVEEGLFHGKLVEYAVELYLRELKEAGIDTLILGCTHYPMLKEAIQNYLGNVQVIDSSEAVARELDKLVVDEGRSETELYFTDRSQNLEKLVETILGEPIKVNLVSAQNLLS